MWIFILIIIYIYFWPGDWGASYSLLCVLLCFVSSLYKINHFLEMVVVWSFCLFLRIWLCMKPLLRQDPKWIGSFDPLYIMGCRIFFLLCRQKERALHWLGGDEKSVSPGGPTRFASAPASRAVCGRPFYGPYFSKPVLHVCFVFVSLAKKWPAVSFLFVVCCFVLCSVLVCSECRNPSCRPTDAEEKSQSQGNGRRMARFVYL